ncbi:hypothetical protein SCANM63S_09850 [Streptomyces canarius]
MAADAPAAFRIVRLSRVLVPTVGPSPQPRCRARHESFQVSACWHKSRRGPGCVNDSDWIFFRPTGTTVRPAGRSPWWGRGRPIGRTRGWDGRGWWGRGWGADGVGCEAEATGRHHRRPAEREPNRSADYGSARLGPIRPAGGRRQAAGRRPQTLGTESFTSADRRPAGHGTDHTGGPQTHETRNRSDRRTADPRGGGRDRPADCALARRGRRPPSDQSPPTRDHRPQPPRLEPIRSAGTRASRAGFGSSRRGVPAGRSARIRPGCASRPAPAGSRGRHSGRRPARRGRRPARPR